MADPVEVLDFWLNEVGRERWFNGGTVVDDMCRDRLADVWNAAHAGGLEHWVQGAPATLAYLIICDQVPRNIHRGSPLAFATDSRGRAAARAALAAGWDMDAPEPERMFFYLPFVHSEDPQDQALAIELMTQRVPSDPDLALHARAHAEIIRRFGRFPFRNVALDRVSSAEETEFMENGGYGALVKQLRS